MERFPDDFAGELQGLTFDEVLNDHPRWIEFVRSCWTENCTGLFLDFLNYVRMRMEQDCVREAHERRCVEYVRTLLARNPDVKLPSYLVKYDASSH